MNRINFIVFFENLAREKLAKYFKIKSEEIIHQSLIDPSCPYDLLYDGKRYDVKVSKPVSLGGNKKKLIWDFDIRGNTWINGRNTKTKGRKEGCDYFILIGMRGLMEGETFLIPANIAPTSHIRISINGNSKYHGYAI